MWAFFETRPDVAVSRLFTDAHDALPAAPDLLGFSFAWELDYVNIMSVLEQLGIPLRAEDRGDEHPLVRGEGWDGVFCGVAFFAVEVWGRHPVPAIHGGVRPGLMAWYIDI